MNQLFLDICRDADDSGFILLLSIDGVCLVVASQNEGIVVFDELAASLEVPGKYLIFSCYCGIADCGGWQKVVVTHLDDQIRWSFEYGDQHEFVFRRENYRSETEKIKHRLAVEKIALLPKFIVDPE